MRDQDEARQSFLYISEEMSRKREADALCRGEDCVVVWDPQLRKMVIVPMGQAEIAVIPRPPCEP